MRSKSKQGRGNSGVKLKDSAGKVVRDRYGRASYASVPFSLPSNMPRAINKIKMRKIYLDNIAYERAEAEADSALS